MLGVDIFLRLTHGGANKAPDHKPNYKQRESFGNPVLDSGPQRLLIFEHFLHPCCFNFS